jgi:hypothetical protein
MFHSLEETENIQIIYEMKRSYVMDVIMGARGSLAG